MRMKKKLLVTGCAGFIGFHVINTILKQNLDMEIVGVDNLNDYYDINLKKARLGIIKKYDNFTFLQGDISDKDFINGVIKENKVSIILNLAAQAGVRYSITNPDAYIQSNILGFYNILEACRYNKIEHLIYASSSSVYGMNKKVPYSVDDKVDNPVSLYAATKKSNELFAHAYSKLYGIPTTGLRFFTVYGPFGRPDMAYFKFTDKIVNGDKIQVYNNGDLYRDFTYIDDIVHGIMNIIQSEPKRNDDNLFYKIYNIGNNSPVKLLDFINILEESLLEAGVIKHRAEKEFLPMQQGDVYQTFADVDELIKDYGFKPETSLETGLREFAKWYKEFYKII